jgi:hypothetical protein
VRYQAAWDTLPEPREKQKPAYNILAAIVRAHFDLGQWEECRRAVEDAFRCGADSADPNLRLWLGQALFELGETAAASDVLIQVYQAKGLRPFKGESPKYLKAIRDRVEPPPGGWPEGR